MRRLKRINSMVKESLDGDHYDDYAGYQKDSSRKREAKKIYDYLVSSVGNSLVSKSITQFCEDTDYTDIADMVGYGEDDDRMDVGENFCLIGDPVYQVGVIGKDQMVDIIEELADK